MKAFQLHIWFIALFLSFSFTASSTHIVGGSLTYVHNGGSSYTVTLKLYRDCGGGTAGLPSNIPITVRGNNGDDFGFFTNKDFTLDYVTTTNVDPNLLPCAIPPNPLPCVEEGLYQKTVTNLPLNTGGYHMYFQIVARNLSLTNINGACNCIGESFYAHIPGTVTSNSNPTFDEFPPLFICANEDFTVDHSATDIDGDSLVYDFYTPYDGDNGTGGLDPTFPGNVATFQPVTYLGGYSYTNPLGGSPLAIATDGTLTGTAGAVGQYVVGVKVKEYRDGVLLSETLRDFQFNVVDCPEQLGLTVNPGEPVICYGETSTTLTAYGSGGTGPYTYLWNNSIPTQSVDVGEGTYTIELQDADNCQSYFETVTVTSYTVAVTADAGNDQTICNQSPTTILTGSMSGASSAVWSGGAGTYTPDNTTLGATYTPSAGEIATGYVDLTLTASINATCPTDAAVVRLNFVGFQGSAPGSPVITQTNIAQTNISCFGDADGTATASITGATAAPYTYLWSTAATTAAITGLSLATYSVTVTDALGCTDDQTVTITQPNILASSSVITNVDCYFSSTGSIALTPTGGTTAYTYAWLPDSETTATISNKAAGTYSVTITDANSCTETTTHTITEPANLTVSTTSTNISCFGGSVGTINSTVSGGTTPYTYVWSSGQTSANVTGLSAGTYTVTVTDNVNCITNDIITITEPTLLTISTVETNETCTAANDGSVTATASGGTSAYTYFWAHNSATTATVPNLNAGTYTVTTTDANGCTATAFPVITEPTLLSTGFASQSNISCFGGSDGSVTANPSGGTTGYTYSWAPGGETTASIGSLSTGTYTVTVTDANSCTTNNTVTITEPTVLTSSTTSTNESCDYSDDGTATVIPAGGTSPYTYLWAHNGATTSAITALAAGTYSVTSTDALGCTSATTATITEPTTLTVSFSGQNNVNCNGGSDGSVTASAAGGTSTYTYLWTHNSATTATVIGLVAGTYTVTTTDANSCTANNTVTITEPTLLAASTSVTNETCDYSDDGTATVTALNGTSPYTYLWSNAATTTTTTGLTAGTYSVTVTDANTCTLTVTATITEPATMSIAFSGQVNVSCNGGGDGAITATASGGTANYTYSWAPGGETTASINSLSAGTYTVTATDANSCTTNNTVTITEPTTLTSSTTSTNESCDYSDDGTATVTPAGGTSPYTYLWAHNGATTAAVTGLSAGTYSVTSTDALGCTSATTATITEPTTLTVSFSGQNNVNCNGGNDGSVTASAAGGTSTYTYFWTHNSATSATVTGLVAGTYTVTTTDANSCTASNTVTITEPTLLAASTSVTNETCDYSDDGTATVTAVNGTSPYTYLWSNAATTTTTSGLTAGTYSVTITDANTCTLTVTATITEPATMAIAFSGQVNVSCNGGGDGAITATASGGTANYTYSWAPGGETNASISSLSAGTYTVTVTDANSCTANNNITITEPSVLVLNTSSNQATCYGYSDGDATATGSGGTAPYSYVWMPGALTTQTITGLSAGTYTVTATDANGCTETTVETVGQALQINLIAGAINTNCSFPNGQASVSATGGNGTPYNFLWSNGETTDTINTLYSGIYWVTVTDALGCKDSINGNVNDSTAAELSSSVPTNNVSCNGGSDGAASVSLNGGIAPFTFDWSGGVTGDSTILNVIAGMYSVTVTADNGCKSFYTHTITEPDLISTSIPTTPVSCFSGNDGTASVTASGGTPGYTYSWLPGASTGTSITGQAAGTYTVQVTDNNTCVQEFPYTITEPILLTVSTNGTPALCFGSNSGTASSTASGGTSPYSYSWNPGSISGQNINNIAAGTYTVTATDFNSCVATNTITVTQPTVLTATTTVVNTTCSNANGQASVTVAGGTSAYTYLWSPSGGTNQTATGLLANSYTVTITDANSCSLDATATVADAPSPVANIIASTNVTCNALSDGTATVSVTGGSGALTYAWSPSGGTAATATGLAPGTYTVVATDANGCPSNATVSPLITEPVSLSNSITYSNVNCFSGSDGSASVTSAGGTPAYSYTWLPSNATGTSITGQLAGTYSVQVTDNNSCVEITEYTISEPTLLSVSATSTSALCFGSSDGTASSSAIGGTAPYSYVWTPGNISGQNISNLSAGTYTITVTDFNSCIATNTVNVAEPTLLTSATTIVNSTCSFANGQADVTAAGGTGTYTYLWSPSGGTNSTATGLLANTYTVTVTDANSCITTETATVGDDASPSANVSSITNATCNGFSDASATVTVTGGLAPFTYAWSPSGNASTTATNLPIGTHTIVVTDANGCISNSAVSPTITEPTSIVNTISTIHVNCFAESNGSASVTSVGGTGAHTYTWLPSNTAGNSLAALPAGTYSLQTEDANNCNATSPFVIVEPALLDASVNSTTNLTCNNSNDGAASIDVIGGSPVYSYTWSPIGSAGASSSGLPAGGYTITITDAHNCIATQTLSLTQPNALTAIGTETVTNVNCNGGNDGTATINPTGGTGTYSYVWSPSGITTQTATNLIAQNYNVSITDANGCNTNTSMAVTEPTILTGTLLETPPTCGIANGSIITQINGGLTPYTYLWSTSETSSNLSNINIGTYTVNVSDANSCPLTLVSNSLSNIAPITLSIVTTTPVSCFGGNDGTGTISINQGTAPFIISWLPYGGNSTTATGLMAGTYTVDVIDANNCSASPPAIITITEPNALSLSASATNISCFGDASGSITITPTGGTSNYNYVWNPTQPNNATANNLAGGTYTITVNDANNCSAIIAANITEPSILSSSVTTTIPACFNLNSTASVITTGGTIGYNYEWSSTPTQNGSSVLLKAGTYTLTTTDAAACTTDNVFLITQPDSILIVTTPSIDSICLGESANLNTIAAGGTGVYTYRWQPQTPTTIPNSSSATVTPTVNTIYTVAAYDVNGCPTVIDTAKVYVIVLDNESLSLTADSPVCPGVDAEISASTLTNAGPVTFEWTPNLGTGAGPYIVNPTSTTNYSVTITSPVCNSSITDTISIFVTPLPTVLITPDSASICVPSTIQFKDNSTTANINDSINSWSWDFGDGNTSTDKNPLHSFSEPGTYYVNLTVNTLGGCNTGAVNNPVRVTAVAYPIASFDINSNNLLLPFEELITTNTSVGATRYEWDFGDGATSSATNPTHLYGEIDIFPIQLISLTSTGCADTAYAEVLTDIGITFPNAFSPNTDGGPNGGYYNKNDLSNNIFFPFTTSSTAGVKDYKFEIFNRWGELIFATDDINQGWDGYYRGNPVQQDVYVWKAYVEFNNGKSFNKNGDVTLLR